MTMTSPSKALRIALWVVQVLLAATFAWAAVMKLSTPIPQLARMWQWVGQVPPLLVKGTGMIDLLGGLGLVLPALLRVKPQLTPLAAVGLVLLMVCATVFHIMRDEAHVVGFNVIVALLCLFVAWGRYKKVPVSAR